MDKSFLRSHALMIASQPVVIVDMADTGQPVIDTNPAFLELTGYEMDEVIGRNCRFLQGEDTDQEGVAQIREAIARGVEATVLMRNYRKDKTLFWNQLTIKPIKMADGTLGYYVGILQDMTDIIQMQSELQEREQYLRVVMDNLGSGVMTLDTAGKVRSINKEAEILFGVQAGDVLGKKVRDIWTGKKQRKFVQLLEDNIAGKVDIIHAGAPAEMTFANARGNRFHIGVLVKRITTATGMEYICSIQDISDRKLVEDQLRQSQKMEAIGKLTGGIAHDFNNALTLIQGNQEILELRLKGEEEKKLLQRIQVGVERAQSLTAQLLAFSRKDILKPETIRLHDVLPKFTAMFENIIGDDIDLQSTPAEDVWNIEVDKIQLETALANLVANARDAMPEGGEIMITARNVAIDEDDVDDDDLAPGDYVEITVADTGLGMDNETREQAFEPFFTTKDVGKGTGLGLSMVSGFVLQSGGRAEIAGTSDKGTQVSLLLPRSTSDAEAASPIEDDSLDDITSAAGDETVLVVDDDVDILKMVTTCLESLGYDVLSAENGPAALELLDSGAVPDLLLTDVVMPKGMSGEGLAGQACDRLPDLRVLFMSGYTRGYLSDEGKLKQKVKIIKKPFSLADLAGQIRHVLDEGRD